MAVWSINLRFSWAELLTLAGLLVAPAFLVPAFLGGWTIALVPGLTYSLALGLAYGLYRLYLRERAQVSATVEEAAAFRVVDARGVCPLGWQKGDLVLVNASGTVSPQLCPPAEAVLRRAVSADGEQQVKQWCCPVFDHLLVFEPELKAA